MLLPKGEIVSVKPDSLAAELGLVPGDKIISINGEAMRDIIDVSFAMADEEIELLVEHADGEREIIAFDKDADEELGAEFSAAVFDGIRRCANNCYFCFVNMLPNEGRASLYVKDDDYRLSFLYGNFITLTNMGERDFQRIERLHLSPLYVSIQAMNPGLRAEILRSPRAANIEEQLNRLEVAQVNYHTQVVLCPGLNDGEELERTMAELMQRVPHVLSLAIVPVGLTKYRRDPYPLRQFDKSGAKAVIEQVRLWQQKMRAKTHRSYIYLSDEFYILAGEDVPPAADYDGFPQLDNGIGLTRSFLTDFAAVKTPTAGYEHSLHLDVICGASAAVNLNPLVREAEELIPGLSLRLLPVKNKFFGERVNVSGLLTGQDIKAALRELGGERQGIILPATCLRAGEDIFLDDMTLGELKKTFPTVKIVTAQTGKDLWAAVSGWHDYSSLNAAGGTYTWQSNAAYTKESAR
ncbi:MAG: DUF512 domain-containing protein [Selenomonadaceae bacterium]|nr:DUF512 domain-containing protein [Selenomonadaceae bacterium]